MIILFKYCADLENKESFKDFGLYIYIYRVTLQDITDQWSSGVVGVFWPTNLKFETLYPRKPHVS